MRLWFGVTIRHWSVTNRGFTESKVRISIPRCKLTVIDVFPSLAAAAAAAAAASVQPARVRALLACVERAKLRCTAGSCVQSGGVADLAQLAPISWRNFSWPRCSSRCDVCVCVCVPVCLCYRTTTFELTVNNTLRDAILTCARKLTSQLNLT